MWVGASSHILGAALLGSFFCLLVPLIIWVYHKKNIFTIYLFIFKKLKIKIKKQGAAPPELLLLKINFF